MKTNAVKDTIINTGKVMSNTTLNCFVVKVFTICYVHKTP